MQLLWMLFACAMFAVTGAFVKVAAGLGASLPEMVMFRGGFAILLVLTWAVFTKRTIRPSNWAVHFWRNLSGITSMWLGTYALTKLALPTAISLNYTAPLFIAGWMLIRGGVERDPLRILAVIIGFVGVIAIFRPSVEHEQWLASLLGLGAGALSAVALLQLRQLGRLGEPEWRTVLLFSLGVFLSGLVGVLVGGWQTYELLPLLALFGIGLAGLFGQLAVTRAFGLGSALLNAALQYTTIIFAALISLGFWGERPALLAWVGMALVIAAGLLSIWRTHVAERTV
ncbi:DMT family transporter [Alcaligenaceae bacterium]|nr:DMT family transporter [Alcaligenaceae bacterium]